MLEWFVALVLLLTTSYFLVTLFRFTDVKDIVLSYALVLFTLVTVSMLLAGLVLQSLTDFTLLLVTLLLFVITAALSYRYRGVKRSRAETQRSIRTWRMERIGPQGWIYGVILLLLLGFTIVVGYLLPPYAYDALGYHLVAVASWVHNHRIGGVPTSLWADTYPKNAELIYTWLFLLNHTSYWLHLGQWLYGVVGIAAVMSIGRLIGLNRGGAIAAGTLFFVAPTVILQATTDYNDLAFTAMFLVFFYFYLRFMKTPGARYSLLAGIAAGLTLGIKSSAVMYLGVCFIAMAVRLIPLLRQKRLYARQVGGYLSLLLVPMVLLGTYWYLRTWVVYGNPLYPFTVAIHGHTLFSGRGTVEQLIMRVNTPPRLLHKPEWQQVWIAWTGIARYYGYDMPIGGFGVQWTFLEFPALILFIGYTWWRHRKVFLQIVLPLLIIFILQPANWWARYTLFMVALGSWAFVYMVAQVRLRGLRLVLHGLILVILVGSVVVGVILFSSTQKRVSSLVGHAISEAVQTPLSKRTVGRVVYPAYQWIDLLPGPTTIGASPNVAFFYPLYGSHAQNRVVLIQDATEQQFVNQIRTQKVKYLMVKKGETYAKWARKNPRLLQLLTTSASYDVYTVTD